MYRPIAWYRSLNQFFNGLSTSKTDRCSAAIRPRRTRRFETLEDRSVLSATFGSALTIGNGLANSSATDVATDSAGFSYVSGMFAGTVDFDLNNVHAGNTDILTARGLGDAYVAKYAPDDSLVWVRPMGGDSQFADIASELAVNSSGAIYVTGSFSDSAFFGNAMLTSVGDSDRFIAKIDTNGNVQWATRSDDTAATRGMDIDATGNVYVLASRLGDAYEVTKFGPSGNTVWMKTIVNRSMLTSADIAVSSAGTVYVAGSFDGTVDFDPSTKTKYVSSGAARAGFVLKLETNGSFGWVSPFVGKKVGSINGASGAISVALDASGNIIVGGTFNGTVDFNPSGGTTYLTTLSGGFITKLNSSGALVWARALDGNSSTFVRGLDFDSLGNIYATGSYHGTVDLNPGAGVVSRTSAGEGDIFILKLTPAGNLIWAETVGGSGNDVSFGISVDPVGNVFVAGYYRDPFDINPDPLATEVLPGDGSFNRGFRLRLRQI